MGKGRLVLSYCFLLISFQLIIGCQKSGEWERVPVPTSDGIHTLEFINSRIGWAVTYGTGLVLKTTDAGKTWMIIGNLDSAYYERIQFVDKVNGWICGEKNAIYRTEDGGKTWESRSIDISGYRFYFYSMFFKNPDEGIVGGMRLDREKNMTYVTITTHNAGKSWIKTENNPPLFIIDFEFLDERHGFVCGEKSIYRTNDGGEKWEMVFTQDLVKEGFRDIYFHDNQHGFAVNAKGDVIRSLDGGTTWSSQSITGNRLRSIVFISEKEGYIAGDANETGGVLYQTLNGGDSWQMINDTLPDLHCLTKTGKYLCAAGKEGVLLRKRI
jgi:photosystem II stability/assembly factor-like uncharacterized protein